MKDWQEFIAPLILFRPGSPLGDAYREINRIDSLSIDEKKAYQEEHLKNILRFSAEHVPYYSYLYEYGVVQKDGTVNLAKFEDLPVLTKDDVRESFAALTSDRADERKAFVNSSGGSTGEPVKFMHDPEYTARNFANKLYYRSFAGQNIGAPELRLWGSERDLYEKNEKLSLRLRNAVFNRHEINAFRLNEKSMPEYVEKWNQIQPQWVEAYVDVMHQFVLWCKRNGKQLSKPKGVLTSAGTLYPEMRKELEEFFGTPVFNRYGGREVGDMACSDGSSDGLKLSIWNHYLEILDNSNKVVTDELGQIHVTCLTNFSMPLIRYRIGDLGIKGKHWQYLEHVEGREATVFHTKDGKVVSGLLFVHYLGVVLNKGYLRKVQLVQKDYDQVLVRVAVNDEKAFEDSKQEIIDLIHHVLSPDTKVSWEILDDIPPLPSGKFMYTVSEIRR